jgi:hypothetical protein
MIHWRGILAGLIVYSDEPLLRVDVTVGVVLVLIATGYETFTT